MKLIYGVKDKPKFSKTLVFAIQQLLAIMAATIAVPAIIQNGMEPGAALFGAGCGTIVYLLFTKFRSPVFLGSSFAFLGSMFSAFAGGVSMSLGYVGLIIGAIMAGLVYVIIAIIVKFAGIKWINKLMPAVVIGPTVAIIGLSLAGNAVGDMAKGNVTVDVLNNAVGMVDGVPTVIKEVSQQQLASPLITLLCALITLFVVIMCSTYGKKMTKLIPFIIGIVAGYAVAVLFTVIGNAADIDALKVVNFSAFSQLTADGVQLSTFFAIPKFTFLTAFDGLKDINGQYIATIAVAYIPVAFVVFAEHIADHKNLSSIIEQDLLENPGLSRTLMGDGVGSMVGAFFGGCPNTTYGESIGCVAITGNASIVSILTAAILAVAISFINPFVAFLETIPSCVMGGVCVALYGFIAVSGLKMLQPVDLGDNRNLFTASIILITGVGGLVVNFGSISLRTVACALILGIIANLVLGKNSKAKA